MRSVRPFPFVFPVLMALVLMFGQLARFAAPVDLAAAQHPHNSLKLSVAEAPVRDTLMSVALPGGVLLLALVVVFRKMEQDFAASTVEHLHFAQLSLLSHTFSRRYALRV